jgi:hypothetical protein
MKSATIFLTACALFVVGCVGEDPTVPAADDLPLAAAFDGVVHHASLGGADICEASGLPTGCDANFSLVANEHADGSVSGQWQDTFAGGGEGIHVAVDCLNVVGNGAVIGGVITSGTLGGVDMSGQRALTAVEDNARSANDAADRLSFSSFPPAPGDCTLLEPGNLPLITLSHGQVTVR